MKEKNTLAKYIETADSDKVALDKACKKLLANKAILARILKKCVEEYKDCDIKEIEEKYIEETPDIAHTAVHQDETIGSGKDVEGTHNEDDSMMEGTVTYDVKFNALRPLCNYHGDNAAHCESGSIHPARVVNMVINVEAQTDFYPGYPLSKRGIYYGSRMVSSQYNTVFTNSHYEKIKKVYSIWVCIAPPKYRQNSINVYSFCEKQLIGNVSEKKENYDLVTVVMIGLGNEDDEGCDELIRLLSVLLSKEKSVDEKKDILENEFGIAMTREMEEEASDMCDYSRYVEAQGIKKGMERGVEKGIEKGIEKGMELMNRLFADGRTEDAMLAAKDEGTRKKFCREYGIAIH